MIKPIPDPIRGSFDFATAAVGGDLWWIICGRGRLTGSEKSGKENLLLGTLPYKNGAANRFRKAGGFMGAHTSFKVYFEHVADRK